MKKQEFLKKLHETARTLSPLTQMVAPGDSVWNGTEYVKSVEGKSPDPYALSWWATLETMAELLEAQESALNAKQIAFLQNKLFGGMGSLNDLNFNSKQSGLNAQVVNVQLEEARCRLFDAFEQLKRCKKKSGKGPTSK